MLFGGRRSFSRIRALMYALIYLGYTVFYIGRKGFVFAMPWIIKDIDISVVQAGAFGSAFAISYGIGKFSAGIFVDRVKNSGLVMGLGLFGVGVVNMLIGGASSFNYLMLLAIANGLLQSFGWPPCSKVLSNWFDKKERGTYWSFWSTSYAVGEVIAPWIIAYFLTRSGSWRSAVSVVSMICISFSVVLALMLKGSPEEFGYKSRGDEGSEIPKKKVTLYESLNAVISNRSIILLAGSYFCVQMIREAVSYWLPFYITSKYGGAAVEIASMSVSVFSMAGALSLPVWGKLADISYKKYNSRLPVTIFALGTLSVSTVIWSLVGKPYQILDIIFSGIAGAFIFGPHMLTGVISVDICGKELAGTVTGFIGMFAYFGASVAGIFGWLQLFYGWGAYFYSISGACFFAFILYSVIFYSKHKEKINK